MNNQTVIYYDAERLNIKQSAQLFSICSEFQLYTNVDAVVFLEVLEIAKQFCHSYYYPLVKAKEMRFNIIVEKQIKSIREKYYFNGIRYANRPLNRAHLEMINRNCMRPVIKTSLDCRIPSAERELFLKIVRACRDFMRAKMSKDAEPALLEKLSVVYDAL
jgi:hypothetical protein